MRVCFVAEHPSSGEIGGAEVAQQNLSDALAARGLDVHYVSLKSPKPERNPPDNITFHRVGEERMPLIEAFCRMMDWRHRQASKRQNSLTGSRGGFRRLSEPPFSSYIMYVYYVGYHNALKRADADVYIQVCAGYPTGYTAHFCRINRRVSVFRSASLRDSDLSFSYGGAQSWSRFSKIMYKRGLVDVNLIIPNSSATADAFRQIIQLKDKVRFISDGFNIPKLPADVFTRKGVNILWVGRNVPTKRADLFLELAERLPEYNFQMLGPKRSDFEGTIPRNFSCYGMLQPAACQPYYRNASLVVSTSEVEGFPNILIEAGYYAVPFVSFLDPDGVIAKWKLGLQCKNLDHMTGIIRMLMKDENERKTLGMNNRRFVEEERSISKVADKWTALFEEMVH